MILCS